MQPYFLWYLHFEYLHYLPTTLINLTANIMFHGLVKSLCSLLAFAPLLASCSLMHDDLEPCDNGVYLHFRYDYNTQRADLFNDHVGGVVVMVYDKDGKYLIDRKSVV